MQPAEPVASGLDSVFVPPTPAIKARLQDYVRCQATTQQAPQYVSLRNVFFFTGGQPPTAIDQTALPDDAQQVALAKWEVDRKTCVIALNDYIKYFATFDKVQGALLATYQDSIRTIHGDLIKGKISFGVGLQQIQKANEAFWTVLAERNKYIRNFAVGYWLQSHATP